MEQRQSSMVRLVSAAAVTGALLVTVPAPADTTVAVGDATAVKMDGKITKVFAETNSVEVVSPQGNIALINVDPTIADVKKLKAGDIVHVEYRSALLMSADKVDPKGVQERVTAADTFPASGRGGEDDLRVK